MPVEEVPHVDFEITTCLFWCLHNDVIVVSSLAVSDRLKGFSGKLKAWEPGLEQKKILEWDGGKSLHKVQFYCKQMATFLKHFWSGVYRYGS